MVSTGNNRAVRKRRFIRAWQKIFADKDSHEPDFVFIAWLGVILFLGILFLSSASSVVSFDQFGDAYYLLKQQIFKGVVFGLIAFYILSRIPYRSWQKLSVPLLILAFILVLLVFVPGIGTEYLGGRRWINLPGFSFQPSEFLKLALIIYLAALFSSREKEIGDLQKVFLPFLIVLVLAAFIILSQPDMGTTVLITAISLTMYFLAGGRLIFLFVLSAIGAVAFWFLIQAAPYRAARFMIFLRPELDPQGIGYHINQAFLAIGSGGLFGRGFGRSRQKYNYLPEVENDSIFAVIAEELGFILVMVLLGIFLLFFYRGIRIARQAPDTFGRLLAGGIMAWIIYQTLFNIMAMVGLIPLTGTPLPFISLGSSSLVILLGAMGIVVNVSKYSRGRG